MTLRTTVQTTRNSQNQPCNPSYASDLTCEHCPSRFKRREHLKRHSRSHSQSRPFPCQWCSKSFARKDTLKRHVAVHGPNAVRSYESTVAKDSKRALRACEKCIKSKQRCDSRQPCQRCHQRGWNCQYIHHPSSRMAQGQTPIDSNHRVEHHQDAGYDHVSPTEVQNFQSAVALQPSIQVDEDAYESPFAVGGGTVDLFDPFPFFSLSEPSVELYGDIMAFDPTIPSSDLIMDQSRDDLISPNANPSIHLKQTHHKDTMPESILESSFDEEHCVPLENGASSNRTNTSSAKGELCHSSQPVSAQLQSSTPVNSQLANPDDAEIILSEDYRHVDSISDGTYQAALTFYRDSCQLSTKTKAQVPSKEVMNAFVQLYFEHFHPIMPVVHVPTFHPPPGKWCLMVAVASIGCQYSAVSNRAEYDAFFLTILRAFVARIRMHRLVRHDEVYVAQAALLYNCYLFFHGTKESLYELQYQRNIIITLCRPFLVGHGSPFNHSTPAELSRAEEGQWANWITEESWRRTIYFTWLGECFQWILHGLPPILSYWEFGISLPCHEHRWGIADPAQWLRDDPFQQEQPSLSTLVRSTNIEDMLERLNEVGQVIAVTSLYTVQTLLGSIKFGPHNLQPPNECGSLFGFLSAEAHGKRKLSNPPSSSPLSRYLQKMAHLLSILRFVPLNTLSAAYGWRSAKQAVENAERHLKSKMEDGETARRLFLDAAELFSMIREQHVRDPYDSFCLLVASLFICAYVRHVPLAHPDRVGPTSAKSHIPLRIGKLSDVKTQDPWIHGEVCCDIHLTGVGILDSPQSATRVFKETVRILRYGKGWPVLAHGMAQSIILFLNGRPPAFP